MNDSIVVYHSEFQRQADIFWQENPEYIFYILIIAVIIGLIIAFCANSKNR